MVKVGGARITGRIDSARKRIKNLKAQEQQIDTEIEVLNKYIEACQFIQATERGGIRRLARRRTAKPRKARRRVPARGRFRGMKIGEAVEIILKQAGAPLKISEMVKRLRAGGIRITSKVPGASVTAALRRHPDKFKMTKPGFYAYIGK